MTPATHQYIDRESGRIRTETFIADKFIAFLYDTIHHSAPKMMKALTSASFSRLLAGWQYDRPVRVTGRQLFHRFGIHWQECLEAPEKFTNLRQIFERQIRYWETRPMNDDPAVVVAPADARMLIGSFSSTSQLFLKGYFFSLAELLGKDSRWLSRFLGGDFAVFRLTPEKYHYNHLPVSGQVLDIYMIDGRYHSCNPLASLSVPSIYSKNRRIVTIIDTDVEGGSQVGCVAMIEIVALMIGEIKQAYSSNTYQDPRPVQAGMFVAKGLPKSFYRPGSSTDLLLFEPGRITFSVDLLRNSLRQDVASRFSTLLGRPLVETEVLVRSSIARRIPQTNTIAKE